MSCSRCLAVISYPLPYIIYNVSSRLSANTISHKCLFATAYFKKPSFVKYLLLLRGSIAPNCIQSASALNCAKKASGT